MEKKIQFLCLLFICQTVCLCHTAAVAGLHQPNKSLSRLGHSHESVPISKSEQDKRFSYADYSAQQVDADNNQLGEQIKEETMVVQLLLLDNAKEKHSPAVQVKVTNEVESALMTRPKVMMMLMTAEEQQPARRQSNGYGNGNDMTDTQNVMPSIQKDNSSSSTSGSSLMSPNTLLPILKGHHLATAKSSVRGSENVTGIDGQIVNDEQLLRLQDYNLLYNAERQTYFQLHTSNKPTLQDNRMYRPKSSSNSSSGPSTTGNRLLHQVVGNTLSAAFGLNTNENANNDKDSMAMISTQIVHLYDAVSLRQSRFNPFNPTRIIIHGWLGNAHANVYSYLVPAYMSLGDGRYNIFTVDWGRGAIADYITASYRVKPVGQVLAKFLDFLHEEAGMRYEDLQLIGFSMGAHVAGLAAKHVQRGRVRVIRALDPALPFFRYAQEKERLTKQDADYVEVLHTSAGSYGFDRPLGHVDFYANWGSQQPGCFWHECSHWRAFALFKESLQPLAKFEAKGCEATEWQQLTRHKQCQQPTGLHLHMGGDLGELSMEQLAKRVGVYYFGTYAKTPYDIKDAV